MDTGRIQLAARIRPNLPGGEYHVEVSQSTNIPDCTIETARFTFHCDADPSSLLPHEIYSVYPPRDCFGKFDMVLPHIIFTRRTYPWERNFGNAPDSPWITLLLFDETEGAVVTVMPRREAFPPPDGVYCPALGEGGQEEPCTVLDVPAELFCDVCPALDDLPYTAHARGVCRDNKAIEAVQIDEWLSVLVSNRYPCSVTGEEGVKNTAYVVSIQGFENFFNDVRLRQRIRDSKEYSHVRLFVLTSWSFHCRQDDFDFKTVFQGLDVDPLIAKTSGNTPPPVHNLISKGFVPLNHSLRDGGRTVSWYKGPFAPCEQKTRKNRTQFFSDSRLIYEPEMGMFDISYASAFTLGRLLAMQSGSFTAALDAWRNVNKREAIDRSNHALLLSHIDGACRMMNNADMKDILLSRLTDLTKELIGEQQSNA
ncbi:hypothetical protein [Akkermansia sp.]|uniref:hypothetical protein n=1 Tax=Akkermansia sp. TaxID=1872421 RepID=UPI0025BAC3FD|nr:hypothetical protein [Akkermansia sp.]